MSVFILSTNNLAHPPSPPQSMAQMCSQSAAAVGHQNHVQQLATEVDREARELLHVSTTHCPELLTNLPMEHVGRGPGLSWLLKLGPAWHPSRSLDHYTMCDGCLAPNVLLAHRPDGRAVVLRRYDLSKEAFQRTFQRGLRLTLSVHHPCVMPVLAAFAVAEHTGLMGYLELPRYEHTLASLLDDRSPSVVNAVALSKVLRQVVQGLARLHEIGILFLHVKPSNIFVEPSTLTTCIGGCGINLKLGAPKETERQSFASRTTEKATIGVMRGRGPSFRAPEVGCGSKTNITDKTDVYSFGVLMRFALTLAMELREDDTIAGMSAQDLPQGGPLDLMRAGLELCAWATRDSPEDRPSAAEMLVHPFFTSSVSQQHTAGQQRPGALQTGQENALWGKVRWGYVNAGMRAEFGRSVNASAEQAYQQVLRQTAEEEEACSDQQLARLDDRLDLGKGRVLHFLEGGKFVVSGATMLMAEAFRRDLLEEVHDEREKPERATSGALEGRAHAAALQRQLELLLARQEFHRFISMQVRSPSVRLE